MMTNTLAPWADLVPGDDRPRTIDDLLAVPDDGWMYELVDGRLVRMMPASGGDSWSAARLSARLTLYVLERNLGRVTVGDGEYDLGHPGEPTTALAPDVAFVREGRYPSPQSPEYRRPWRLAPDLAVEIVSPNQYRPEMAAKARRYLTAGVRLVWIVWPHYRQVDVWRPGADDPAATLGDGDHLDGEEVVPGFRYPVAELFT